MLPKSSGQRLDAGVQVIDEVFVLGLHEDAAEDAGVRLVRCEGGQAAA